MRSLFYIIKDYNGILAEKNDVESLKRALLQMKNKYNTSVEVYYSGFIDENDVVDNVDVYMKEDAEILLDDVSFKDIVNVPYSSSFIFKISLSNINSLTTGNELYNSCISL